MSLSNSEPPSEADRARVVRRGLSLRIVAVSTLLAVALLPVRAKTVGFWLVPTLLDWRGQLPLALATAVYDAVFVFGVMAVSLGVLWLPVMATEKRARRVWRIYVGFAIFTLTVGLVNIPIVAWLGQPFTYQWLTYSDFLRSGEAMLAVAAAVPWWQAVGGVAVIACFGWGLVRFARWFEVHAGRVRWLGRKFAIAAVLLCSYAIGAHLWLTRIDWTGGVVVNPIWSFARSCVLALHSPGPFAMPTPFGADDFHPPPPLPAGQPATTLPEDRPVTRNVIFFVLESVGSRYVDIYGSTHGVTPELDRVREHAMIFTNAYAHAPATNLTLVALLNSIYPRVSFRPTTSQKPDIELDGIGEVLRHHGRSTSFFSSAPLNYHRAGEFLADSGDFDLIEDSTRRVAHEGLPPAKWEAMGGSTDRATIESMIDWIEARGPRPFFTAVWTNQTHFPYLVSGETRDLVENSDFNRYLNALSETDAAFGRLMRWLEETGRDKDTLVVVLGDHGEAFGQHRNYGHAGHVYEENIHIPLMLVQPGLFEGETNATVCGVVDIVPTVAEILRLPAHADWQGRSLFSTQRTGRVYFFAAWSDFLMGYREGDMKKVYNAANDRQMVFDLATDPEERHNLAPRLSKASSREITQRVAAWVQHIEDTYRPLLEDE